MCHIYINNKRFRVNVYPESFVISYLYFRSRVQGEVRPVSQYGLYDLSIKQLHR